MTCPHCNRPRRHDGPASTIGSIPPDVILTSRIASACASASRAPSTSPRASSRGGGYRERALSLDDLSERGDAREFDEPHAGPQLAGPGDGPHERARRRPADGEVGLERGPAAAGEGDDALLVALAVANQQAAAGEVAVGQVERAQLGAADAGVEEEEHHGGIAPPDGGGGIARRHQARELGGAKGCTSSDGRRTLRRPRNGVWSRKPAATHQLKKQRTSRK